MGLINHFERCSISMDLNVLLSVCLLGARVLLEFPEVSCMIMGIGRYKCGKESKKWMGVWL